MSEVNAAPRRRLATWTYLTDGHAAVEEYRDQYDFNDTATLVWLLCDGRHTPLEIAGALAERHGDNAATYIDDVIQFLSELGDARLLEHE